MFAVPKLFRVSCLILLALSASGQLLGALQTAGKVVSATITPDAVDLKLDSGAAAHVELLDRDLVRIQISRSGTFSGELSGAIATSGLRLPGATITENGEAILAVTPLMTVVLNKNPFRVVILRPDGSTVSADTSTGAFWDDTSELIFTQKIADPDEAYFGLGERGGPINRRGRSFVMHNVDSAGYTEFTDPLYISIPFFYGILKGQTYGIFVDNPADPFFDMDSTSQGLITFGAHSGELNYYVFSGPEPARVASSYAKLTGFNKLPPKWSLGYHQSRYGYKSQDEFLALARDLRSQKIPCDVLWLDIDYMDRMRLFTYNMSAFPNPAGMHAALEKQGFKRVSIIEPLVRTDDPYWIFGDRSNFFLTNPDGTSLVSSIWYGDVSFYDFTDKAARAFYKQALGSFLSSGTNGLWVDLNEPAQSFMPQATYGFDGRPRVDLSARNLYALRELDLLNETWVQTHPNERFWGLSRSGYSGIQRYSANWSGDTLSTFDSLRVSLEMTISMGFSGQNFFGHDIGGFLGSPNAELFTRWFQFGSYIPLFRNHATNTTDPREPWVYGNPYTSIVRAAANRRYQLLPYLYSSFYQATVAGTPVVGPLPFHFPADTNTYSQDQSFMLGPSLLIAPVVEEGATTREVYLPIGADWYDYNTDEFYAGGTTATANAPLHSVPVFVRAGAIIPSGPVMQYTSDPAVAPSLNIDIYLGPTATFVLYEDDGATMAYTSGASQQTVLIHRTLVGADVLTMQRSIGKYQAPGRPVYVVFHGAAAPPAFVQINRIQLPSVTSLGQLSQSLGYFYDRQTKKLTVRFEDSNSLQVTVGL